MYVWIHPGFLLRVRVSGKLGLGLGLGLEILNIAFEKMKEIKCYSHDYVSILGLLCGG